MTFRRLALAVALAATLAACNQTSAPEPAASPAPEASPAPAETPTPATTDTGATGIENIPAVAESDALAASSNGSPIGIAACDEYLDKYQACITAKVPEPTRASLLQSLNASREAWRQSMGSPGAEEALSAACTQAREAAKPSLQAYGCTDF
jgi:hypothetical protein